MKPGRMPAAAFMLAAVLLCSACSNSSSNSSRGARPEDAALVVAEFLDSVRTGDDVKAAALLTQLAREKTAERQLVVAPPGSETAHFQVGETQLVGGDAHVAADWTDLDADGNPHTDRIVWVLRRGNEGWRIAGMSSKVFADQEPVVLDFEDPDEMARRQQLAEDELARRDRERTGRLKNELERRGISR